MALPGLRPGELKLKNPYLNVRLYTCINMNSHIQFQENPSNGLGEVVITSSDNKLFQISL